jgi:peptide/nickel transport system permease protein
VLAYVARRFIGFGITLLLVSIAVFIVLSVIPGNPAQIVLGMEASPAAVRAMRARLGLDRPPVIRYLDWLSGALHGDLGVSLSTDLPVSKQIASGLTVTLPLTGAAIVLALTLAVPLGAFTASHHRRFVDYAGRLVIQAGMILPEFLLGLLLILLFAVTLHWLPAGGFPGWGAAGPAVAALLLPAAALSLPRAAVLARMARASFLEVLDEGYVTTARGKGLPNWKVLYKHAMRNALASLVTLSGLLIAQLIAGSIIIENVFGLRGVGRLAFQAIEARDLPLVQGTVVVVAFLIALVNLLVDLTYGLLDPRVRYE